MLRRLKKLWSSFAKGVQIVLHYLVGLLKFCFPAPSGPQMLHLVFEPTYTITLKGETTMTVIQKQGATVLLRAVDADGLDIAPNTPANWEVTGGFAVVPAADTLSAQVGPLNELVSAEGQLTVSTPDGLVTTADIIYTAATVAAPAALKLTFQDNAA